MLRMLDTARAIPNKIVPQPWVKPTY
jgi:hypothetical protein